MVTRAQIVAEARTWIGTPWRHQGRLKGVGVDCIGLLACIAKDLGIFHYDVTGYSRQPNPKELVRHIEAAGMLRIPKEKALPADAALIDFGGGPQHLAILSDYKFGGLAFIHALSKVGYVAEHRLPSGWLRGIWRLYRFPGIED